MSLFDFLTEKGKEKRAKINDECNNLLIQIDNVMQEVSRIFSNTMEFVDVATEGIFKQKYYDKWG